ncbi:hypothetical protein RJ55_06767 [Drechmeria coniospora]|nr:hypothetical protein RJ55_06767 [Drechmeria coniospora]
MSAPDSSLKGRTPRSKASLDATLDVTLDDGRGRFGSGSRGPGQAGTHDRSPIQGRHAPLSFMLGNGNGEREGEAIKSVAWSERAVLVNQRARALAAGRCHVARDVP